MKADVIKTVSTKSPADIAAQLQQLALGNQKALARSITWVENDLDEARELLSRLQIHQVPVIGITGPPGAGKSTLISALVGHWLEQNLKVAVVAIDPSSPFNQGSILGDRLRMSEHFLNGKLFIRSMASRGSLGGLAPRIFEVCDVLRAAGFDRVVIETVGVGQSEVEIAGLADTTVLVVVPEAGDEIQTIKSGIMEIADVFVVNKADREGADVFVKNLQALAHQYIRNGWEVPVVKTSAIKKEGIAELAQALDEHHTAPTSSDRKLHLMALRAMMMIREQRTRSIQLSDLENALKEATSKTDFNLYRFVLHYNTEK